MSENLPTNRTRLLLVALALIVPVFAGCVADGGEGRATVYVKDAPSDEFKHVNITFSKVAIHQGEDENASAESNDSEEEPSGEDAGWITAFEGSKEIDLLAFSEDDSRAFLGDTNLSAGTYNQILITVDSAHGITTDGEREEIRVITGWIRVVRAWQVEANQTTRITVDLDMDRSLVQQGPRGWALKPVVGQVLVEEGATGPEGDVADEGASSSMEGSGNDTGEAGSAEQSQAPMTVYTKDAPTDEFREIYITFDEVTVHYAGNGSDDDADDNETETNGTAANGTATNGTATNGTATNGTATNDTDEESDDGRWITTVNETRTLDLLAFSENGSKAFLGDADVPTGRYTQIRVNITDAYGIDNDGDRVNITVSSGTAKVNRPWTVADNGTTTQVTIDLDLDRSLVATGGGGGGQGNAPDSTTSWRMTPVIGSVLVDHVDEDPREDQPDPTDLETEPEESGSDGNETSEGNETSTNASTNDA